jgi:integrase/recombinase XerD
MEFMPCLARSAADGEIRKITLGHPLLDDYLVFVAARARTSTWLAVAYDLKVFFEVVGKEPAVVTAADVFAFLSAQRVPRRGERVVRLEDGEAGLAARTACLSHLRVPATRLSCRSVGHGLAAGADWVDAARLWHGGS